MLIGTVHTCRGAWHKPICIQTKPPAGVWGRNLEAHQCRLEQKRYRRDGRWPALVKIAANHPNRYSEDAMTKTATTSQQPMPSCPRCQHAYTVGAVNCPQCDATVSPTGYSRHGLWPAEGVKPTEIVRQPIRIRASRAGAVATISQRRNQRLRIALGAGIAFALIVMMTLSVSNNRFSPMPDDRIMQPSAGMASHPQLTSPAHANQPALPLTGTMFYGHDGIIRGQMAAIVYSQVGYSAATHANGR